MKNKQQWNVLLASYRSSISKAPFLGLMLIWLLACGLSLIGLGDLPLRDFDEATVARVAFELSQKQGLDKLLPTLWDSDYLNKAPGLHWMIALVMQLSNHGRDYLEKLPSDFVVRLAPALLSTLVVPLGGLINWYLRPRDTTLSISTAAILLTLLPLARHGKLAMLDGTQLSVIALFWLFLVSIDNSSIDKLRAFGAGIASSFLLLLKAPVLLPAITAAALPILFEKNQKLWRVSLLIPFAVGLVPGISWHIWHGVQRGSNALWLWGADGATRVLFDAGEGSDLGFLVPLIEVFEGGWPWLLLWPLGMLWAWQDRHTRWGKWALGTQLVIALSILPLKTQLPWYSHPLWLPFSLICARPLAWLIKRDGVSKYPGKLLLLSVPYLWLSIGLGLIGLGIFGSFGFAPVLLPYTSILFASGFGWTIGGWLLTSSLTEQRAIGFLALIGGSFLALCILMRSSFWLWELNENWLVRPVAQMALTAKGSEVFIEGSYERPSLDWYAGKKIKTIHKFPNSGWLLTRNTKRLSSLAFEKDCKVVQKDGEWALVFCQNK